MALLSVIVPCHNEEEVLPLLMQSLYQTMEDMVRTRENLSFEVLLVDDGSQDETLQTQKLIAETYQAPWLEVSYLSFSRQFGKEAAMYAGLCNATGDYVAIMDADLQDPPDMLPQMLDSLESGEYDCVALRRVSRKGEPAVRSFFARRFYRLVQRLSNVDIPEGARDYRLMCRTMVDAIVSMGEYNRFSKGIFSWVGFKTQWLEYENVQRAAGETHWSFFSLMAYSLEGIVAFSTKPLLIASFVGILFFFLAIVLLVFVVVRALLFGDPVAGWPSLVCLLLMIGGIQLFCLGVVSQYIAKTYVEVKQRPIYIVRETNRVLLDHPYA